MISSSQKKQAISLVSSNSKDTGSTVAQISIITERIKQITDHMKVNKHDFMARRGLLQLVGRRKRLLKYLASKDAQQYLSVINKLGIRK